MTYQERIAALEGRVEELERAFATLAQAEPPSAIARGHAEFVERLRKTKEREGGE